MRTENFTTILGDCIEKMKQISDESVDLILCDPPYGQTRNPNDVKLPLPEMWMEYMRIIKPNGCIALFAQGKFFVELCSSNLALYRYDLIWDKVLISGFLNAKKMPLRQHEKIAIFYKSPPPYHPQFTHGKALHSKGQKYMSGEPTNRNYRKMRATPDERAGTTEKYPTSILRFQKPHPSKAQHPTEKPVDLLAWLIKTYTDAGALVLDNCMGSGSTGVACIQTGRKFIGIEIDEETYKKAENRIKEAAD